MGPDPLATVDQQRSKRADAVSYPEQGSVVLMNQQMLVPQENMHGDHSTCAGTVPEKRRPRTANGDFGNVGLVRPPALRHHQQQ